MQDDYIDCFGDPELTGKVGTDIEDNKCSWLIVQALAIANHEQRAALEVGNDIYCLLLLLRGICKRGHGGSCPPPPTWLHDSPQLTIL